MPTITIESDELVFRFPEVHADAVLRINLPRTLRIPDDGKTYPLPPGLGRFPMKQVDDHRDRVPATWLEHGGVIVPVFQSEALWICFRPNPVAGRASAYPCAIRVAAGKVSAVSGNPWATELVQDDYVVAPPQPWLDGFAVEKGKIRQFVAMPLGAGLSVEQQITGKEEHGGLQIEVYPMRGAEFDRRFPVMPPRVHTMSVGRGGMSVNMGGTFGGYTLGSYETSWSGGGETIDAVYCSVAGDEEKTGGGILRGVAVVQDMALGAGGLMKQDIAVDTFGLDVWERSNPARVFVHMTNSLTWQAITGQQPPTAPRTAADYSRYGLPWFEHYMEGTPIAAGGKNLAGIKSVLAMGFQKGMPTLPENESVDVKAGQVQAIKTAHAPGQVRSGRW